MNPDEINELSGGELPLAMRMMEHLPSISASIGFATMRGSNTILGGGFLDDRAKRGPGKLGGFAKGSLTPTNPTAGAYYGSSARRARLASVAGTSQGKMALGKGSRVNHLTARPRALSRYHSLTAFNASKNTPFYSPFQFLAQTAGKQLGKNEAFRAAVYGSKEAAPEEQVLQRGMVSMITAGRKADLLERKAKFAADGTPKNRAATKVLKAQEQVKRLATMNNPALVKPNLTVTGGQFGRILPKSANAGIVLPAGQTLSTGSVLDDALKGGQKVGLTGNLMASAGASQGSRFVQGYFRGALGFAEGTFASDDALRGAQKAVSHFSTAVQKAGIAGPGYEKALQGSVVKNLGGIRNAFKVATKSKEGASVLGIRTAAMAMPGLNLLATASLVYDLGKMGGELVKSGINLAKDAVKSMKGSIDKPMFGMGYKDNEVSATSRARGVMAIQNSRLNARSMLGSEGSMMAAHFG